MLGIAQEMEIRLLFGIEADPAAQGKARERRIGALLAKIARDSSGQFLNCDGGSPQPEARRHRREFGRYKQVRLQPFDRVFVGEAKKSSLEKCIPPCLRPVYEKITGMRRPGSFSYGEPLPAVQNLKANIAARSGSTRPTTARGTADED